MNHKDEERKRILIDFVNRVYEATGEERIRRLSSLSILLQAEVLEESMRLKEN